LKQFTVKPLRVFNDLREYKLCGVHSYLRH